MSVQDLTPEFDETTAEPENLTVRRLVRAIDYAEGFWLGFAKSNTPAQRRRLAALCKDLLEPLKIRILEIELTEPVTDLLPVLRERLGQESATNAADTMTGEAHATTTQLKIAIFVHGLEHSIPSREAYPPLLSSLNLKRELFRQEVPHPLLLWLPDYALTALARKAPDFWAWRSGLYEFAPERESAEQSLKAALADGIYITDSLPEQAKRDRLVMLKGLLDDYRELGNNRREQEAITNILNEIGLVHEAFGEWADAQQAYKEMLNISRGLEDNHKIGVALHTLGRVIQEQGDLNEARRLYNESLEIVQLLGDKRGLAYTLGQLGNLALDGGEVVEARRHYGECLKISREIDDQSGIAASLYNLAMIVHQQGDLKEAESLYNQSLEIRKDLGDQRGIADSLYQLALLSEDQDRTEEARRLYGESLAISNRIGDLRWIAPTLNQLGILAEVEGDKVEAALLFHEALSIFERIGSPDVEIVLKNLMRLEGHKETPG